ncbi:MAG TPA: hypothetical protein VKQ30_23880, partial [Ktedonobacterales bacterium]|nr:hypothetical protein [Ktedonobacterales bacterium]
AVGEGEFVNERPLYLLCIVSQEIMEGGAQGQFMVHSLRLVGGQFSVVRLDCPVALANLDALPTCHVPPSSSRCRLLGPSPVVRYSMTASRQRDKSKSYYRRMVGEYYVVG